MPTKLPPLPLFIRGRAPSPPEEKEEAAIVSEELNLQAGIVPLVFECTPPNSFLRQS